MKLSNIINAYSNSIEFLNRKVLNSNNSSQNQRISPYYLNLSKVQYKSFNQISLTKKMN